MNICFTGIQGWQRPQNCSGSARPGARALMAHFLESTTAGFNLGIYNCRTIGGSSTLSTHAEGRAVDLGNPVTAAGKAMQYEYLSKLAPHAGKLGLCYVIFDRKKWRTADPCGTYYGGVHPHDNHSHIELTRAAAEALTLATIRNVVGDFRANPIGGGNQGDDDEVKEVVEGIQRSLKEAGFDPGAIDGVWGPKTEGAHKAMTKAAKASPEVPTDYVTKQVFNDHYHVAKSGKPSI